jgi:hypothetical protein
MEQAAAVREIADVLAYVEENWTANDGGLTMAGSDLLAFGSDVLTHVEAGDWDWCRSLSAARWDADSTSEAEILDAAYAYGQARWEERRAASYFGGRQTVPNF